MHNRSANQSAFMCGVALLVEIDQHFVCNEINPKRRGAVRESILKGFEQSRVKRKVLEVASVGWHSFATNPIDKRVALRVRAKIPSPGTRGRAD